MKEWALACPGIDLLRLFPGPPVQPWDESPSGEPLPEEIPSPTPVAPSCGLYRVGELVTAENGRLAAVVAAQGATRLVGAAVGRCIVRDSEVSING